ncbi:MAG: hypothetical protein ACR2PT_11880 [Endozoicomonas sp.]
MNQLIELREARLRHSLGEVRGEAVVENYPTHTGFSLKLMKKESSESAYVVRSQRDRRMPKRYATLEAVRKELDGLGIRRFVVDLQKQPASRLDR